MSGVCFGVSQRAALLSAPREKHDFPQSKSWVSILALALPPHVQISEPQSRSTFFGRALIYVPGTDCVGPGRGTMRPQIRVKAAILPLSYL